MLSETPAGPAGSSSGAGWSGALDAPREELTRVAEESHTAAEGAAPRAEWGSRVRVTRGPRSGPRSEILGGQHGF